MLAFLSGNVGSFAVLAIILVVIGLVVFKLIRDKKRGKKSCGCGCGSCPMKNECHK